MRPARFRWRRPQYRPAALTSGQAGKPIEPKEACTRIAGIGRIRFIALTVIDLCLLLSDKITICLILSSILSKLRPINLRQRKDLLSPMTLTQKSPTSGTLEFELGDDALTLRQSKGSQRLQTKIPYSALLPDPDHRAASQRGLLYAAGGVAFFIVSLLLVLPEVPDDGSRHFVGLLIFCFLIGFIFLILRFFKSRYDVLTYFYRNGSFAFNIWRNRPDETTFSEFVGEFGGLLKKTHDEVSSPPPIQPTLSAEIDRLGALRLKGLLTDQEFARAKESLLSQLERDGRVVGFHS